MTLVAIDGSTIESLEDLHDQIPALPGTPDFYGRNLDALWDVLIGFLPPPLEVRFLHADRARQILGADFERVMTLLQDACREIEGSTFSAVAGPPRTGEDR